MKLSEALSAQPAFSITPLLQLTTLQRAASRVLAQWPNVAAAPEEKDREKLVQEMKRRVERRDWADARISLVCRAGHAVFDAERRARSDLVSLRNFYWREIRAADPGVFLDAMMKVYILTFDASAPHTKELAEALQASRAKLGGRGATLVANFPQCLEPAQAALALARRMVEMGDVWKGLQQLGIASPHAPGLTHQAHAEFVRLLRPRIETLAGIKQLLAWLRPEGQRAYVSGAASAITAILSAFENGEPRDDIKNELMESLTASYGDPRLQTGGIWTDVPEGLRNILCGWLAGRDIFFFLDVVSAVEKSHMWPERRAFWEGLLRQKRIDSAWVALSPAAAQHASSQMARQGAPKSIQFGGQIAGGSRADTSLLIMKIGERIVVEGSHNYKVHIFLANNPVAPRLYQPRYDCEEIRLSLPDSTQGTQAKRTHGSGWQDWVLQRI
jgi:hypothetical protein